MEIILVAVVLWYLGTAIESASRSVQSIFDYWADGEMERLKRKYKDDCEYNDDCE